MKHGGAFGAAMVLLVGTAARAGAQGGPPLMTDDPGTPGKGRWEINLAFTGQFARTEHAYELPLIDANYGMGDHLQLTVEGPADAEASAAGEPRGGFSYVEVGAKWRFADQGQRGMPVDASIYPQLETERGGLPEWTLPVEISRSFGRFAANVDAGLTWEGRRPGERFYGVAIDFDPENVTELMAEVHATTDRLAGGTETIVNLGVRQHVAKRVLLLASAGHSVAEPDGEPGKLVTYVGLSFDTR